MYTSIHPTTVLNYFNQELDYQKTVKLCSPSLIRCVCFLVSRTQKHNSVYVCFCFKCNLARMLIHILRYRRHDCLLYIIADRKNRVLMSERYVRGFFLRNSEINYLHLHFFSYFFSRQKVKVKKNVYHKTNTPKFKNFKRKSISLRIV